MLTYITIAIEAIKLLTKLLGALYGIGKSIAKLFKREPKEDEPVQEVPPTLPVPPAPLAPPPPPEPFTYIERELNEDLPDETPINPLSLKPQEGRKWTVEDEEDHERIRNYEKENDDASNP